VEPRAQHTTDSIQKKGETQVHFQAMWDEWGDTAKEVKEHLYDISHFLLKTFLKK
jgi:hypothetical protein